MSEFESGFEFVAEGAGNHSLKNALESVNYKFVMMMM